MTSIKSILLTPPSNNVLTSMGFLYGVSCVLLQTYKKPLFMIYWSKRDFDTFIQIGKYKNETINTRNDLLEHPISTMFGATMCGVIASSGTNIVARMMPEQFTPAIPIVLGVSMIYTISKYLRKKENNMLSDKN